MGLKIDRYQLELDIKPNKSQQELQALNVQLTEANKKLTQLGKERDKINASIKKENAQDAGSRDYNKIEVLKDRLEEVNKEYEQQITVVRKAKVAMDSQLETIGVTGLTLRQLSERQRELNSIVRNLTPDSADYNKYKAQLDEVNARMKSLKGTATETKGSLQGLAEGFNKYAAMGATAMATLAGMGISAEKSVQDFADMNEAESQVVKYTNLTKAEVEDLNEDFKKMDTRTSREELNKLAGDAGKLGIDGKKNILDFVDAGNQIKIALGEDLGQDAITNIGKIASMFGDDKKLGLKQAMLSSGSAINQLGQDSSATEAYILDFTYRLAGAGKVANMTQTEIMGLASALEQNGQEVETSSTAISQLLIRMYQDPSKFAKLAGIDVKEFIHLLSTNGNEALLKFASAMSSKGGLLGIAPMFEKMNLDGTRSVGVLSTIAKNIDQVKAAQKDAADAYSKATSVTKEYDKQNSTAQAQIEKKKKALHDISVELGKELFPSTLDMISAETKLAKTGLTIISVVSKYGYAIISLSAILATYLIAQAAVNTQSKIYIALEKASAIAAGIKKTAIELVTLATFKLNGQNALAVVTERALIKSMMAFPGTWLATSIAALIAIYVKWEKTMADTKRYSRELNESIEEEKQKKEQLKKAIEELLPIAQDETRNEIDRGLAIEGLKNLMPDYFKDLDIESAKHYKVAEALAATNKQYKNKLLIMAKEAALKYDEARTNYAKNYPEDQVNLILSSNGKFGHLPTPAVYVPNKSSQNLPAMTGANNVPTIKQAEISNLLALKEAALSASEAYENLNKEENKSQLTLFKPPTIPKKNSGGKKTKEEIEAERAAAEALAAETDKKNAKAEAARNKAIAKAEKAEKEGYDRNIAELKSSLSKGEMTQEEYHEKAYQEEIAHIARILKIKKDHGANSTSIEETNNKLIDAMTNEANYQKEKKEKDLNKEISMLDDDHNADLISLAKDRLDGTITTEEEYQQKMKESDMDYYQQKKTIQEKYGKDSQDIDKQIYDIKLQDQKTAEEKKKSEEEKAKEDRLNIAQQAFDEEKNLEKKSLMNQSMYDAGLISYAQYQKNKTNIAKTEAEQRTQIEDAALQTVSDLASSASQLFQSMQSKETSKVETKYSKLIKAAQKAGKDTTKLEEQEEAEKLAIKKKYANKEFQMTVLGIIAKTAEAIMKIAAEWAWNPVMEGILIGATVAEGAVQLAVAKNTRDEAAGLYEGGYSDGYTGTGNPRDVAGVIPVHKNEFVANHKAVGNPAVRQFLDVFDASQKDGTISMMNTTDILDKVRITGGKYDGGYTGGGNTGSTNTQSVNIGSDGIDVTNKELLECLIQIMGYTKATAEKDTVTIRDIKKKIQHIDTLEKNASR